MGNEVIFDPVKSGKASHKIVQSIRKNILCGKLKAGDRLPAEPILLESFSVSRQTLREALRVLETQGFLELRAGAKGGTFVAEVDMDITKDNLINFLHSKSLSLSHLSSARLMLEPHFGELAAKNMTDAEILQLEQLLEESRTHLANDDRAALRNNEIEFHRCIAHASRNPFLIMIHDFIIGVLKDAKRILEPGEDFSHNVIKMHEKIFDAITKKNSELTAKYLKEDIEMVEKKLQKLAEQDDIIQWEKLLLKKKKKSTDLVLA